MRTATEGRTEEEPRRLPEVSEGREHDVAADEQSDEWVDAGTEDPAFFIKPSDGE